MTEELLLNFRFQVALRRSDGSGSGSTPPSLGNGGFQECSGLEVEMDVQEHLEGGRNDGVVRLAGRAKYQPIVLKRGMFRAGEGGANRELWVWIQGAVSGTRPLARYDGSVHVLGEGQEIVASWAFRRGLPAKVSGPALNAKTGDVAIEELHIAHEGLELEEL